ncbi:hypothetical protein GGR55DRAFT_675599 [Xylaria sp. FL0064]|nr:hypothetical protein GGR55DRAFT_675599 [Xylaria sp. FL0064]
MAAVPNHGAILSDINEYRKTLSLSDIERQDLSDLYDASYLEKVVPKGFPSMAVSKIRWPNAATFRTFKYLDFKRLEFYETKLAYLENQLHELEKIESTIMKGSQKNRVPFNKSFINHHFRDSDHLQLPELHENMSQDEINDRREILYAHIERLSKEHHELVRWLEKARKFHRVHILAYPRLLTMAREHHELGNEAVHHLGALDEIAYTSIDPVELWIQNIRFSSIPWIQKILRWFPTRDAIPDHKGSQTYEAIGVNIFLTLHKVAVILCSLAFVLVPAGLFLLAGLSRALSYGVIVIFGILFSVAILIVEQRIGHAVVGIVAYLAFLATFLATAT